MASSEAAGSGLGSTAPGRSLILVGSGAERDATNPHAWAGTGVITPFWLLPGQDALTPAGKPVEAGTNPMCIDTLVLLSGDMVVYSVAQSHVNCFQAAYDRSKQEVDEVVLTPFGQAASGGEGCCYVEVVAPDATNKLSAPVVLAANYEGSVSVIPVDPQTGRLGVAVCVVEIMAEEGAVPGVAARQGEPHPHMATYHAGLVYVPDLGINNSVFVFRLCAEEGGKIGLDRVHRVELQPGAGPRHVCFPAPGICAVDCELDNTVVLFSIPTEDTATTPPPAAAAEAAATTASATPALFTVLGSPVSSLPAEWDGWPDRDPPTFYTAKSHLAGIAVVGHQLLVTNRGHDSVSTLDLDTAGKDGPTLTLVGTHPSDGALPWSIQAPGGDLVLVSNETPGSVAVLSAGSGKVVASAGVPRARYAHTRRFVTPEDRARLLPLPEAPAPAGTYKVAMQHGNLLYVSGHGPSLGNGQWITGKLGRDLGDDQGAEAARVVAHSMLATLRSTLSSLNRVKQVVRLFGMVNATPDFADHITVINGFANTFADVFGLGRGVGARSAVGMGSLPMGICVEVEAIIEVFD